MKKKFLSAALEQYTADHIADRMSLRTPQRESLRLLDTLLTKVRAEESFGRSDDLQSTLREVNSIARTCKDFEREFMSLTFALATGVGKTRLAGAFIVYLYCNFGVKNFFVVAPNITIYEKLRRELGDPSNDKYVFKGAGCFGDYPATYSEDDYKQRRLDDRGVNIYVYNIDKFNSESAKMRQANEINEAFIDQLSRLDDLVLIMDESHHYRAAAGAAALNLLKPALGLELTATPLMRVKNRQEQFQNVVYEYALSSAIADGYTRVPYALTRHDIENYNFKDRALERLMLEDGLKWHEKIKARLKNYAEEHGVRLVKPFVLVVCQDTDHATEVERLIRSKEFHDGYYIDRTLMIHSKQKGADRDENIRRLLAVERTDNPIEIVIHVNILKEGWDVNNLYTIVPLRSAASMILREQMVGRGLRLPYGVRTGDEQLDSIALTAHDKFDELIEAARSGNSIFKRGRVIDAARLDEEKTTITQPALPFKTPIGQKLVPIVQRGIQSGRSKDEIVEDVKAELRTNDLRDEDLYVTDAELFERRLMPKAEEIYEATVNKYITIPRLAVVEVQPPTYEIEEFDLDPSNLKQTPQSHALFLQSLTDARKYFELDGGTLNLEENPRGMIVRLIRGRSKIDYRHCAELLQKLVRQAQAYFERRHGSDGAKNILFINRGSIAEEIYRQMMMHLVRRDGVFAERILEATRINRQQTYTYKEAVDLYDNFNSDIRSVLFTGIEKGVFDSAKFDSKPELIFARIMERDADVIRWLRPAAAEFEIKYDGNRNYEPDFVAETSSMKFLIEVKRSDMVDDADVVAKRHCAEKYCDLATEWSVANHQKPWRHMFIPSDKISSASTFEAFVLRS